jgi:Tfp pilus assembly protein PilN
MLKLTAEARSREAMLEYVRRIAQTKGLSNVYIVSHQVQTEDPSRPIQFSVQASLGAAK